MEGLRWVWNQQATSAKKGHNFLSEIKRQKRDM